MLLAINVGNTRIAYGIWDGQAWIELWHRPTQENGVFAPPTYLKNVTKTCVASVVPAKDADLDTIGPTTFLRSGEQVGLPVEYSPSESVGADRIANCLGALATVEPPFIVVDLGTATTFDVVDKRGVFVGGAIMPGLKISAEALTRRTAQLPEIDLIAPPTAIAGNTRQGLQSGIVLGHAGAVDSLVQRMEAELGQPTSVIATGGFAPLIASLSQRIQRVVPTLTLDGLVVASARLG
jgi:type III pantothenate kinase